MNTQQSTIIIKKEMLQHDAIIKTLLGFYFARLINI
jgi:hypothetical protein